MNILQINQLKKTYANGVAAINDVSLHISNGMFGLLGPNGSGKSSLMRTIASLQAADSGSILLNETNILNDPLYIKQRLGYLPQDFGVYPKITAYDLLSHLATLKGITNKTAKKEQVLALLEKTNLLQHRNKEVYSFSGGMKQRFGIAQALLANPQIIIVDEPTAGLDPEERSRFNNLLSEIGEQVIVILSTHIVEDVKNLCSQMAIINNGKVLCTGSPAAFVENLSGKIWSKTIEKHQLQQHQENYQVISSTLFTGKLNLHVFSQSDPGNGFTSTAPSLEDVYFSTLRNIEP
ncbi:MAG: ABC transporter ATP-binding protein [Chitinophagaceae bacterium]|nr:MAG: ABC transporter ATP-binding protein [Chitinophagaceae bacterium]